MADDETGEDDARRPLEELADLAHGLARVARRQRAMGARRTGLGSIAGSPIARNASQLEQQLPPGPRREPVAAADRAPEPPPPPAPRPLRGPGPTVSVGLAPGCSPEDVRRAAAACTDLGALATAVAGCRACPLGATRKRSVFADGAAGRRVLFVGEAPGYHEDQTGVPFVGDAGQLLTDIITKGMGLDRARDVFICNVLKCRPPENRDPLPEEKVLCTGWLDRQIELVDPLVIVALGRHAATHLLGVESALGRLRGRVHQRDGRPVIVTYHPAYLLRNPADKRATWQDIQLALRVLGLPLPGRRGSGTASEPGSAEP
jgi:uracil-DNA glycosylase family 4